MTFLDQFRRPGDVTLEVARAYLMADIPTEHLQALETCRTFMDSGPGVNSTLAPLALLLLLGEKEEAQQLSLELLEPLGTSIMRKRSMALEVVAGRRSSDAVLDEIGASRRTQAVTRYVIAVDLLSQGRREAARSQFREAATITGCITNEAHWSQAFYERLSADPAAPPWIPVRGGDEVKDATEPSTVIGGDE